MQPVTQQQELLKSSGSLAGLLTLTICQTCMMLSSDTEHITHGSLGFQEKSEILAVCPPWMNYEDDKIDNRRIRNVHTINQYCSFWNCSLIKLSVFSAERPNQTSEPTSSSGGPSSASSADCSSPILLQNTYHHSDIAPHHSQPHVMPSVWCCPGRSNGGLIKQDHWTIEITAVSTPEKAP